MSEKKTWAVAGCGTIGSELGRQLAQPKVADRQNHFPSPEFIIRSDGVYSTESSGAPFDEYEFMTADLDDIDKLPDALYVATPSTENGEEANELIEIMLQRDCQVITAEKGATANYFAELRELSMNFRSLGIDATVGGGNRLMEHLRLKAVDPENISQIHLALNGTLNAIFSSVTEGSSLGGAVYQATQLGYAEPGAENPSEVIRQEAEGDIPKKTAITFNRVLEPEAEDCLDWRSLKFNLTEEELEQVREEAVNRRFIVSIYSSAYRAKHGKCPESDVLSGFIHETNGWTIVGGFRDTRKNPLFEHLATLPNANNGYAIGLGPDETDGIYVASGPGAGPRPTVNAMLDNFKAMNS